jgi:hypothetical protein
MCGVGTSQRKQISTVAWLGAGFLFGRGGVIGQRERRGLLLQLRKLLSQAPFLLSQHAALQFKNEFKKKAVFHFNSHKKRSSIHKSPITDDQIHCSLFIAVSLNKRALHDVSVESHAPNRRKLILTSNEILMRAKTHDQASKKKQKRDKNMKRARYAAKRNR